MFEAPKVHLPLDRDNLHSHSPQISLIGLASDSDNIRYYLSRYHLAAYRHQMLDLGNVNQEHLYDIHAIISTLIEEGGHIPLVILPTSPELTFEKEWLDHFDRPTFIRNDGTVYDDYHHIGLQRHLLDATWVWDYDKHLRLSQLIDSIDDAEVLLRNSDYIDINLNVLRMADFPGTHSDSTAGLSIEALCKLAKFIGASTQLKAITISGYDEGADIHQAAARNVAMIIWYVMEGYLLRKRELEQLNSEKRYTVIPDEMDAALVFIEHQKTGRWWIEFYDKEIADVIRMACTKEDYESACQNDISDRLTSLFSRV